MKSAGKAVLFNSEPLSRASAPSRSDPDIAARNNARRRIGGVGRGAIFFVLGVERKLDEASAKIYKKR